MGVFYKIYNSLRVVDAWAEEILTEEDLFRYQQEVWSQPEIIGFNEIFDLSHVVSVESIATDKLRELANLAVSMDMHPHETRFAIVAKEALHFGLSRMYEIFRELNPKSRKKVKVFTDREKALEWLGLPDDFSTNKGGA